MNALADFVGKPYKPGADGPDAFDCWGLSRAASLALFNRALPSLPDGWHPTFDEAIAQGWEELEEPEPGAVMALGNYAGAIKHVCICLTGRSVLNTGRDVGAHVGPLSFLRSIYPVVRFYRWT